MYLIKMHNLKKINQSLVNCNCNCIGINYGFLMIIANLIQNQKLKTKMCFDYHKMCALILININLFSTFTFFKNQGELNHIIIEKHKFNWQFRCDQCTKKAQFNSL